MDPERRKHIRRGIARNPATPPDLVRRLAVDPDALQEICRWREDLTEDLVEAIIALGTPDTADWLGDNATLSHDVMWLLARQADPEVRMAAVLFDFWYGDPVSDVPVPLLEQLAEDPDHLVRWVVATHPHTPAEVLVRLAADPVPRVRAKVASTWRDAPEEVRRRLLADPEPEVRNAAL